MRLFYYLEYSPFVHGIDFFFSLTLKKKKKVFLLLLYYNFI